MEQSEKAKRLLDLLDQAPKGAKATINFLSSVMEPEEMHDVLAWMAKMYRAIEKTAGEATSDGQLVLQLTEGPPT